MPEVVIVGGGIIGCAIAYYLTEKGCNDVVVVERTGVACHSSGKAGGFLARGWGSGSTSGLHKLSFDLIEGLSKELSISSYRKISTLNVSGRKGRNVATWLDGDASSSLMDDTTAQVTPKELTQALLNAACKKGAKLQIGTVCGLNQENGAVTGVQLSDGQTIDCNKCVIAMGVWSTLLGDWIGDSESFPIEGIRSTSIIYKEGMEKLHTTEPYCLFCGEDNNGCHLEVYPRPEGEIYICGCGGSDHINGDRLRTGGDCEDAEKIIANPKRVKAAMNSFSSMVNIAKDKTPEITQACMRPCPPDALPMIGKVPQVKNVYIAAGHNCWGILWSAATGLLVSELILGKPLSLDISPFSPSRFIRSTSRRGRHQKDNPVGEQW